MYSCTQMSLYTDVVLPVEYNIQILIQISVYCTQVSELLHKNVYTNVTYTKVLKSFFVVSLSYES